MTISVIFITHYTYKVLIFPNTYYGIYLQNSSFLSKYHQAITCNLAVRYKREFYQKKSFIDGYDMKKPDFTTCIYAAWWQPNF